MDITVKLSRNNETKKVNLEQDSKVEDLLKKINLKPDTVIAMHGDKPIPIDEELTDGQEIIILQVSSGG